MCLLSGFNIYFNAKKKGIWPCANNLLWYVAAPYLHCCLPRKRPILTLCSCHGHNHAQRPTLCRCFPIVSQQSWSWPTCPNVSHSVGATTQPEENRIFDDWAFLQCFKIKFKDDFTDSNVFRRTIQKQKNCVAYELEQRSAKGLVCL